MTEESKDELDEIFFTIFLLKCIYMFYYNVFQNVNDSVKFRQVQEGRFVPL